MARRGSGNGLGWWVPVLAQAEIVPGSGRCGMSRRLSCMRHVLEGMMGKGNVSVVACWLAGSFKLNFAKWGNSGK